MSKTIDLCNSSTNMAGNRVLKILEEVVFTLTKDGVVPTGVALSLLPSVVIMAYALVAFVAMRKRKEEDVDKTLLRSKQALGNP